MAWRSDQRPRCQWALSSPLMTAYHDREWGVPQHRDQVLFEFLILEGAQAGLSWETILKKRRHYRRAFDRFDPATIAQYTAADVRRLLRDPGIIRNRAKIEATIVNARAVLAIQKEFGSFDRYIWKFVGGTQVPHRPRKLSDIPSQTPASVAMSRDLRRYGFRFVGPTICYAFMQAVGMVDDHTVDCFRSTRYGRRGRGP